MYMYLWRDYEFILLCLDLNTNLSWKNAKVNSVDLDQTALLEQSVLSLLCLHFGELFLGKISFFLRDKEYIF